MIFIKRKPCYSNFIILFVLTLLTCTLQAQDTHYWSQQFGSKSALLGGAVVGGVRDNSAIYYNPGALALVDSTTLSVSATGYQYDILKIKNGAGDDLDLKSRNTSIIPLIITGTYKFKKLPNHTFGYTVVSKMQTGMKFSARNDAELNVIEDYNNLGNEEYVGQFNLKTGLSEQWFGGSHSYKINKYISAGFTAFVAYRNQSLEQSTVTRTIPFSDSFYYNYVTTLISSNDIQSVSFDHLRGFAKLGISFDFEKIKFGFTVTTPGVKLYSSGVYLRDIQFSNLNANEEDVNTYVSNATTDTEILAGVNEFKDKLYSYTANDRQDSNVDKMAVDYKTPLSISGGVEILINPGKLSIACEWFDKIDEYNIISPEEREVLRPKSAKFGFTSTDFMTIRENNKTVFNYSIGYELAITRKTDLVTSFRTNKSYARRTPPSYGTTINQTFWDIKHIAIGIIQKQSKSDLSLGLSYAFGTAEGTQYVNLTAPKESLSLVGELQPTQISYQSYALLLGYTYYFK